MASSSFVAVNWNPGQMVDEDSLDQMNNNITYLNGKVIDARYTNYNGSITSTGIKLLCGRAPITARKSDTATITIHFSTLFRPNSNPIITTSIVSPSQMRIMHAIKGIGTVFPNHQGFQCAVNVAADKNKNDKIAQTIYVYWIAMGA